MTDKCTKCQCPACQSNHFGPVEFAAGLLGAALAVAGFLYLESHVGVTWFGFPYWR